SSKVRLFLFLRQLERVSPGHKLLGHLTLLEVKMETLLQDLRYAIRAMLKTPGFTVVAILSLALGIVANAAIFSLVNTFLFRPLPVYEPARLVEITPTRQGSNFGNFSYPLYRDFRDRNDVLDALAVYRFAPMSLSLEGNNERIWGYIVSGN